MELQKQKEKQRQQQWEQERLERQREQEQYENQALNFRGGPPKKNYNNNKKYIETENQGKDLRQVIN